MKLKGHIPIIGGNVEVDLLLIPNTLLLVLLFLSSRWEWAWKFKALWNYFIVDPLGIDLGTLVLIIPIGTLIGTLWLAWKRLSSRATGRI